MLGLPCFSIIVINIWVFSLTDWCYGCIMSLCCMVLFFFLKMIQRQGVWWSVVVYPHPPVDSSFKLSLVLAAVLNIHPFSLCLNYPSASSLPPVFCLQKYSNWQVKRISSVISIHENPAVSVAPAFGLVTFNQCEVVRPEAGSDWSFYGLVVTFQWKSHWWGRLKQGLIFMSWFGWSTQI